MDKENNTFEHILSILLLETLREMGIKNNKFLLIIIKDQTDPFVTS